MSLIPTKLFINEKGLAKIEIAIGKGKKLDDKREDIKKRDIEKQIQIEIAGMKIRSAQNVGKILNSRKQTS